MLRKHLKYGLLFLWSLCLIGFSHGQFDRFWILDGQIRNYGFDLGVGQLVKANDTHQFNVWGLRVGNIQHPKEIFVVNQSLPASEPWVIDKVNRVWTMRPYYAWGFQIKERKSRYDLGVHVLANVELPLAYAWPIYVWVYQSNLPFEAVQELKYKPDEQPIQLIGGESSVFRGIKEGQWIPGLGLRGSIAIEWGSYKDLINTLSVGVMTDFFVKEIPILYSLEKNPQILPALFVNFAIGFGVDEKSSQ